MYDANTILQASVTKTANFNSAALDLKTATPRRGLFARVIVTAASGTTPTADFKIQQSSDNSTWSDCAAMPQMTTTGEQFMKFETNLRYVRLVATIGGTTPSFTYQADVSFTRP